MLSPRDIQSLINEIAQGYQPEKIYLFGSYADNRATEDSDLDLFILKRTVSRKKDRGIEVREAIKSRLLVGLDIIVYTPEEMKAAEKDVVNIGKEAILKGKLMYERV